VYVVTAATGLGIGTPEDPGPGFLPFWSGLVLAVLAIALIAVTFRARSRGAPPVEQPAALPLRTGPIAVVALFSYAWILPHLGYLIATTALMMVLFAIGRLKPRAAALASLLAALSSYALFRLVLKVPLPRGIVDF